MAVVAFERRGVKGLAAFVMADQGVSERDIRRFVIERTPSYMVPSSIELVHRMPRTANGKFRAVLCQVPSSELPEAVHP